jgi:uncharacterized protein (TIGR00369 family)
MFVPKDPDFVNRVRASFARQSVMTTIGATMTAVEPGAVAIELPFRADLCQQHGFLHAGVVATIVDSACGYAALTLMQADAAVLSIEFKANFTAPAAGERFVAQGRVVRAGRTITVCTGEVFAVAADREKSICLMQATMMALGADAGLRD